MDKTKTTRLNLKNKQNFIGGSNFLKTVSLAFIRNVKDPKRINGNKGRIMGKYNA